jgi:hypothetical protein
VEAISCSCSNLKLLGSKTRPGTLSLAARSFFVSFHSFGVTASLFALSNLLSFCLVAFIQNGPMSVGEKLILCSMPTDKNRIIWTYIAICMNYTVPHSWLTYQQTQNLSGPPPSHSFWSACCCGQKGKVNVRANYLHAIKTVFQLQHHMVAFTPSNLVVSQVINQKSSFSSTSMSFLTGDIGHKRRAVFLCLVLLDTVLYYLLKSCVFCTKILHGNQVLALPVN